MSNREIARQLGVDEASVRRGLNAQEQITGPFEPKQARQYLVTVTEVD